MDRTTARRIFNEFTTEVDINRPDGILRSSDVDNYVEKTLKPLIEEGKAFRQVSVNRRAGVRSTRYSYQGGKKIQDSVNAVLAEMPAALGYDIDPATGNVAGSDKPPPMSVTNQGRRYYNETRERILDPRTSAAIRADALRAGGVAITDKATGYTTTLIRSGLSGETRRLRKLVDDTDAKYLEGTLPSSALADGASPATVVERTRAQVARQAQMWDARQLALKEYIDAHPESWLAREEARKTQKITNRQEKARYLAERRKQEQRRRGVRKAGNALGRGVYVALDTISTLLGNGLRVLGTIYSATRDVGDQLRKNAADSLRFNLDLNTMTGYQNWAKTFPTLGEGDKDIMSKIMGALVADWGVITNLNKEKLRSIAPYVGGAGVGDIAAFFTSGALTPDKLATQLIDIFIRNVARQNDGIWSADTRKGAITRVLADASILGPEFAKMLSAILWEAERLEGKEKDNPWALSNLAKTGVVAAGLNPSLEKYQNTSGVLASGTRDLADEKRGKWSSFLNELDVVRNDLLTKLLANSSGVLALLKNFVMAVSAKYFPALALRLSDEAERRRVMFGGMVEARLAEEMPAARRWIANNAPKNFKGTPERFLERLGVYRETKELGVLRELGFTNVDQAHTALTALSRVLTDLEFRKTLRELPFTQEDYDRLSPLEKAFTSKTLIGTTMYGPDMHEKDLAERADLMLYLDTVRSIQARDADQGLPSGVAGIAVTQDSLEPFLQNALGAYIALNRPSGRSLYIPMARRLSALLRDNSLDGALAELQKQYLPEDVGDFFDEMFSIDSVVKKLNLFDGKEDIMGRISRALLPGVYNQADVRGGQNNLDYIRGVGALSGGPRTLQDADREIRGSRWVNDYHEWINKDFMPYLMAHLSEQESTYLRQNSSRYSVEGERVGKSDVLTIRIVGPDGKEWKTIRYNERIQGNSRVNLPSQVVTIPLWRLSASNPVLRD
jgi:hypothetical protein